MKMLMSFLMVLVVSVFTYQAKATSAGGQKLVQELTYDYSVNGGAVSSIDLSGGKKLPVGAVLESGYYIVQTAFTSSGSATIALGNATTAAKYLAATAFDNAAYTANTPANFAIGVPSYISVANDGKFKMAIAGAALTAGKMKVVLNYYVPKQ